MTVASSRRNLVIASNLFLASTLLLNLPHYYMLLQIFSPSALTGSGNGIAVVMVAQGLLSLAFLLAVGLGIRYGQIWAKVLFVFYALWNAFLALGSLRAPTPPNPLAWGLILLPLGCLLVVGFFLFRNPAAPSTEKPVA
ncbi:hypothetical protein K3G63_03295 [Hymenobacter sp. HSC-4F20]|uniref:hypothetical protein n=1 Tax=Hymenobacter sp. HSC-4F20 TaxID=2864135 RepID=UPI001C739ACB|nr:hypothetical protein [Hymenobacter sp. HSC-4F20]MBX0289444.1 hypothetical protein [Hymenobacter sp. HSC-4F20]